MTELERLRKQYDEYADLSDAEFVDKISRAKKDGKLIYPTLSKRLRESLPKEGMKNLPLDKVRCIQYDYGLFEEVAVRLAQELGEVNYYVPYKGAFPKSSTALIGSGLKDVIRIPEEEAGKDFFDFISEMSESDLFVFCDIMDGDLQTYLRSIGKRVWGSGHADKLEIDRWKFRQLQKKLGMPCPVTEKIRGITKLKERLKNTKDVYLKIALWRGDIESFHFIDWKTCSSKLEEWEYKLGAKKELIDFLIESPIKGVEVGFDSWSIDGKYPSIVAYGYEIKGRAYVGRICNYADLPKPLSWTNEKLSSTFKEYGLRGFYSNEIRIGRDKIPHIIDMTIRAASPPSECMLGAYSNMPEIIYEGAAGRLVIPKPIAKYMALARICSEEASSNWMTIDFPEEIRKFVKLRNAGFIENKYQIVPGMDTIGSVIGFGNTAKEATEAAKKNADKIKGIQVEVYTDQFDKALEEIEEGKECGIDF
jgi:hypothetical protein